jgi:hypothetical protein
MSTSGITTTITSAAMLATLPTLNKRVGLLLEFWNAATETIVTYRLMTSALATGAGVQRPTDWNAFTNRKAWIAVA